MPSLRARWSMICLKTVCPKTACLETVCLVVAISLLLPTLLPAQGASGRILGRVADPTGAVLSAAKVTLTNEATGISRDATTNDSGDYSFVEVAPGTYTLQFELTGFKKNVQKSVILDVNQVVTLNSTLQI
ncbi:MAG: carboxypeptidase-like regulatory domain-containing protein, partial [Candidatus Sulfotelmatobacter sp.]